MSLLGEKGLRQLAALNHARACEVAERLAAIPGVELVNDSFFNEFTLRLPVEARPAVHSHGRRRACSAACRSAGSIPDVEALENGLVVAVTETVTDADIDALRSRAEGGRAMTVNPSAGGRARPPTPRARPATVTGNRALMLEEPLLFEIGDMEPTGVDFEVRSFDRRASSAASSEQAPIGLAGLSEPETVRHYTRLSRQNYAIDLGLFPLGSCTMKHNPRLNEKLARLPGFADIHPLQPQETVGGAIELINELA